MVLDRTADKFDDSVCTGGWRTDPMGILKGGESCGLAGRLIHAAPGGSSFGRITV